MHLWCQTLRFHKTIFVVTSGLSSVKKKFDFGDLRYCEETIGNRRMKGKMTEKCTHTQTISDSCETEAAAFNLQKQPLSDSKKE